MSTHDIANQIAAQHGWTTDTTLDVVLDYISNQSDDDAFRDYLTGVAEQDNMPSAYEDDEDEDDEDGDRLHDELHSAAEAYASEVNNSGPQAQRAFLIASGVPADQIEAAATSTDDDALNMLVIEVASQSASYGYNNGGTAENVRNALIDVFDPSAGAVEFTDETHG